jgi:hypothetical protein
MYHGCSIDLPGRLNLKMKLMSQWRGIGRFEKSKQVLGKAKQVL